MNKLILRSLLNALGVIVYIAIVAAIIVNGEKMFGTINPAVAPVAFLMTFVLSAGVTGGLVLGKPVLMYLDNEKSDAVKLFIYTLCWLALGTIIIVLASVQR